MDSVGLPGRSGNGLGPLESDVEEEFAAGDSVLRASRGVFATLKEEAEALIVANRLLRSSKGAPVATSLENRCNRLGLSNGVLDEEAVFAFLEEMDKRDDRGAISLFRAFKKTVCGTTPNFCNSMFPMTFRLLPVSGS